jgi:hypothetical protein
MKLEPSDLGVMIITVACSILLVCIGIKILFS